MTMRKIPRMMIGLRFLDTISKHDTIDSLQDSKEKIMDAKVMKKGDKKLIIVDMPDPKAKWIKKP